MYARLFKGLLILLLPVCVGCAGLNLLPSTAQASPPRAVHPASTRLFAAEDAATDVATMTTQTAVTGTVTPGPTTPAPLLQVTTSPPTAPCDISSVVVTLHITNVGPQATPADSTLVINLPTDFTLVARSGGVLNGTTLTVAIGAIAPGSIIDITLTFQPLAIPARTIALIFTASVVETGAGSTGEVLSNVLVAQIPLTPSCVAPTFPPTSTPPPTNTPGPTTSTPVPPTAPPATSTPVAPATSTPVPPATSTPVPPPTSTPVPPATSTPLAPATSTPPATTRPGGPSGAPTTPAPPQATAPGTVSGVTATPTHTPTAPAAGAGRRVRPTATPRVYVTVVTHYRTVVVAQYKTVPRYKTIPRYKTVTRYKTIPRYKTITVTRYKVVPRYKTVTLYQTQRKTVVTYKVVVRQRVRQVVKTVVHHKTVMRTVMHVVNKTVVHHKMVVVKAIQIIRHPTTGRFAAPRVLRDAATAQTAPPSDTTISIPRLAISNAPVWTRGYTADQAGGLTYDIVPFYGLTRFSYSAPFGTPGLTMVYGHDDIFGSIFRYLSNMKPNDRIAVATGGRHYTYVVRSVSVVSPTDVSMITSPRARPTLALISCTPYWVDTQRVVVIAQMI